MPLKWNEFKHVWRSVGGNEGAKTVIEWICGAAWLRRTCREEIEKHSAAIRAHFKNKGLTYLYIANYDLHNEEQWKKLIAYFDMEGTHLLANQNLTTDIMKKLKKAGFPTEFIIKKDGTFELSKTDPIKRDHFIQAN